MKTIFLSGFMGSGKTTIGESVALAMGLEFIDSDELIEKKCGKSIPQIFREDGEEYFRQMEFEVCKQLSSYENKIVSTGGGMMTFGRCFDAVCKNAQVVFIDVPFDICYDRIKNSDRPIVLQKTKDELERLFDERRNLYLMHSHKTFLPKSFTITPTDDFIEFISK